ncbi:hypothetical protein JCM10207_007850 [Rhodosporidiobolus poonsookiae]
MDAPYTPYYCEENVYQLLLTLSAAHATEKRFTRLHAVFISNLERHALLFHQKPSKAGEEQDHYVIWDYHVVAVGVEERSNGGKRVVVLDRDSRLGGEVELSVLDTDT